MCSWTRAEKLGVQSHLVQHISRGNPDVPGETWDQFHMSGFADDLDKTEVAVKGGMKVCGHRCQRLTKIFYNHLMVPTTLGSREF